MVELGLDPTNQDFLPDNDTVYVDEGQFTSSSILHLHLFAMPHMFMFKSSLNQQKTVFAICAPCKKLCFQIRMFFYVCFLFGGCVEGDIPRLCIAYGCLCFVFFVWTRSYAALRAADLDWIVGPGYSLGRVNSGEKP